MSEIKRNILLNPGPATTTDSVKYAQVVADICPREKEFGDLMEFVSNSLTEFVAPLDSYTTILFGGSGTAAVESVLTSSLDESKKILIINNGAYGKRMCEICKAFGLNYIEFRSSPTAPIVISDLEKAITSHDGLTHLAVIHNETTTGLLNDLSVLGPLAKKYKLTFIVDAMSSYAAVPIDMQEQQIDFLCASSNKNIQGMAGVSFVIAKCTSLDELKAVKCRNFYLNLYAQYHYFKETHQTRFTPPVQTLYALKQAILELQSEGVENRYQRYSKSWETLLDGLEQLGLKTLVERSCHSRIITSIELPAGVDFGEMHDYLFEKGITIYPGKLDSSNTFRIANIGAIDSNDLKLFLSYLAEFLKRG